MKKIGFIGLGSMGKPMATNLLKAGFPLTVYDIREEPLAEMQRAGAMIARSTREVGEGNDTVIVMVLTYPQVMEAISPPEGALAGMRSGSTLIIMSTISPREVEEAERVASKSGVTVIDAPVSGGRRGAEEGSLTIMVGGEGKAVSENEALFKAMGKNVYHVGEKVGLGQAMKMTNQILVIANTLAIAEALVVAKKLGLNLDNVFKVISNSHGDSFAFRTFGSKMISGDYETGGAINTLSKDSRVIMNTGIELEIPLPISSVTYQLCQMAESRGLGRQSVPTLVKVLEELSGVKLHDS